MKTSLLLLLLCAWPSLVPAQVHYLKQLERKAKRAFKKEAFGMALYHSQAILKMDSKHPKALKLAVKASEKLGLSDVFPFDARPASVGPTVSKNISPNISQEKKLSLIVSTYHALDSNALHGTYIGITNDGFGEGLFAQNSPSGNSALFDLPADGFYTITATKDKYGPGVTTISSEPLPVSDTVWLNMYLTPSWGSGFWLYFDHEKPTSADTISMAHYGDSWLDYLYRINEYIDSNAVYYAPSEKAQAQIKVGRFFANEVDANYQQLETFCGFLEEQLSSGVSRKITLVLEARLSEAERTTNGNALLDRRLQNVENYFSFYKNGLFTPWLENGQLLFLHRFAETTHTADKTGEHPVFGINAAKSRTVFVHIQGQ